MGAREKLISRLQNSPKSVRFEDIRAVLEASGYTLASVRGSHHKFKNGDKSVIIPRHKPIKAVYVKMILKYLKEV